MIDNTDKRVWEHTGFGWASRPADKEDKTRALLMSSWAQGLMTYEQVIEELRAKKIDVRVWERSNQFL